MSVRPDRDAPPKAPRWVKVMAIVAIALFLLYMIARATIIPAMEGPGGGMGFERMSQFVNPLIRGGKWA